MVSLIPLCSLAAERPEKMLADLKQQAKAILDAPGTFTGEVACWQANYRADRLMNAFRETGDPAYIAAAVEYFDALLAKVHTSPDGYRGWVGPYVYDGKFSTDVIISDAILAAHMLDLARLILKEKPENFAAFRPSAENYVAFARQDVIAKWDARGTWHEDGPYGYYTTWPMMFVGEDLSKRVETRTQHDRLGYQFNKQTEIGLIALRLGELTGERAMLEKAARIARLVKSRLTLWADHYTWNYWEPVAPSDIWSLEKGELAHWVGTHPHRHYQINELRFYVDCYRAGLVFDRTDMERFAATHDRVMWNGDYEKPHWKNSDAAVIQAATGAYTEPTPPPGKEKFHKGAPWSPLAAFSSTIRRLSGVVEAAENMTESGMPPEPFAVPMQACSSLKMGAVLPASVKRGEPTRAVCALRTAGEVTVELFDAAGTKLRDVFRGQPPKTWIAIQEIQTNELKPGEYTIRWSKDGEFREARLWVR